ncbi:MAG: xanthine dehydrogenase family protein molybdopterin-binding subunit [Acidimicrobiia bacterium]|nr:xanthine dehydrogenase family protein molybdopterin-binding subunit [Acidimicrobiia bacterium]
MTHPLFGTEVRRIEDPPLLRGQGTYVANVELDNALVAHFVTSIHAHAEIGGIDVSEALTMPGVVAVVTAADLVWNGEQLGPLRSPMPGYPEGVHRPALADDRVRFVGQPVAVVVAETAALAADAAEMVVIDYRPLPAVVDPRAAVEPDAPLVFDHLDSNVLITAELNDEPIDFSDCEVVVTETFHNQRIAPSPLETRSAASLWTDDGRLVHYMGNQGVHPIRNAMAAYYGLGLDQVRVVTQDVGGSFGAKAENYPEDMLLPFLAHRTGRPVRWTPARSADMTGLGHSRDQYQRFTIGGDRDGTIKAMEMHVVVNNGAYSSIAPAHARNAGMVMPGPFRVRRSRWTYEVVATNTTPQAAYRGAGRPEGGAAVDRAVDRFAAEIGLDPLEVRRRNMLQADELPWTNPTNLVYESGDYPRALDKLVAELDYDGLRAEQAARRDSRARRQLGIGLSTFIDRTAAYPGTEFGAVQLKPDGSFRVLTGSSPHGQGHHTSWAMLVAERTGVPMERIEVVHGDTDVVPRGGMTGGSKAAQKAGNAVALAADEMVEVGRATAAELLEAAVGDVVLDGGVFHVTGAPGAASIGWVEVAERLAAERGTSDGDADESGGFGHQCVADFDVAAASVPYGAYGAVVEVDVETGAVELIRMVTVDDAGAILNPMLALGQVHGGLGQAIGQALYEEFVYDADGNPLTANFLDYGIPAATELPSFESHLIEIPTETNPLGVKGIGESAAIGGVPAVQNAVIDAVSHLGVKHLDLPVRPLRVWEAVTGGAPSGSRADTSSVS